MYLFLQDLSVDVISLFEVKSRRRRNDVNYLQRKAFRLCIDERQVEKLLDENRWPADIAISYWFFKGQTGQPGPTATSGTLQFAQSGQQPERSSHLEPVGQSSTLPAEGRSVAVIASGSTSVGNTPAKVSAEIKSTRDDDAASLHMDCHSADVDADDTIILNSTVIEHVIAHDNTVDNTVVN